MTENGKGKMGRDKIGAAMLKTARGSLLTVLLLSTLVLAACGGSAEPAESTDAEASGSSAPSASTAPASAADSDTASSYTYPEFSPDLPIFTIVSETDTTRVVRDARGEVTVPKNPQKIVTLDDATLDILLGLGVEPIATVGDPESKLSHFFDGRVDGVQVLPGWEPNAEAILALEPDLIVGLYGTTVPPELYQSLSKIAPTLISYDGAFPYERQPVLDLAALLDRSEQAKQLLADLDQAKAAALEKLPAGLRDGTESFAVLTAQAKEYRISGVGFYIDEKLYPASVSEVPYADLRLTPPTIVHDNTKMDPGGGYMAISLEVLPDIKADHVLVYAGDAAKAAEMENSPLFKSIPAVQKGNVYHLTFDSLVYGPVNHVKRINEFVEVVTTK